MLLPAILSIAILIPCLRILLRGAEGIARLLAVLAIVATVAGTMLWLAWWAPFAIAIGLGIVMMSVAVATLIVEGIERAVEHLPIEGERS